MNYVLDTASVINYNAIHVKCTVKLDKCSSLIDNARAPDCVREVESKYILLVLTQNGASWGRAATSSSTSGTLGAGQRRPANSESTRAHL